MKAIWTKSKPEYHGEFVNFAPIMTWPKPVQKPHPPVIVGGTFPYAARRALRYGDGWMPHTRRPQYDDIADKMPEFRKMAEEAGRKDIPLTAWDSLEDYDRLRRYRDLGFVRATVSVDSAKADAILPVLDRWAALMRRVNAA